MAFLPEYFYIIVITVILTVAIITHAPAIVYMWKRKELLKTHVRVIIFKMNHTIATEWVPVDELDANAKIVTTQSKKTFLYRPGCIYRMPKGLGMYGNEPVMFLVEDYISPLKMEEIMKKAKTDTTSDEFNAAINTKVFIDLMKGVQNDKMIKWILIACVIVGILYLASQYFGGDPATAATTAAGAAGR